MPINEKEYNGNLFDQLSLLEEIEEVAQTENATKTLQLINKKRRQIERKLYQSDQRYSTLEDLFHPHVEEIEKSTESYVKNGNEFKDKVLYEIIGKKGFLTVTTTKQQITNIYKTYERILTFSEGTYFNDFYEIKADGVYQVVVDSGNRYLLLLVALDNLQWRETYQVTVDSKNEQITTVFKGQTEKPLDKNIVIKEGDEEYELVYISNTEISIHQTQPLKREIGTLDLN